MKPAPPARAAYGTSCSGCGECCVASLCPLGSAVFKTARGPCPALGYDGGGKSYCGLIVEPEKFAPIEAAIHGRAALSEGAAILCGAGLGCDALSESEARKPGVREVMLAKCNAIPPSAVAKAFRVWRLG